MLHCVAHCIWELSEGRNQCSSRKPMLIAVNDMVRLQKRCKGRSTRSIAAGRMLTDVGRVQMEHPSPDDDAVFVLSVSKHTQPSQLDRHLFDGHWRLLPEWSWRRSRTGQITFSNGDCQHSLQELNRFRNPRRLGPKVYVHGTCLRSHDRATFTREIEAQHGTD